MKPDLSQVTEQLLDAARKAGADSADAIAVAGESLTIEIRSGDLENAGRAESVDIGLRVLVGNQQACVSASDAREQTFGEMAERAVAMAKDAPVDPFCGLADPSDLATAWDVSGLDMEDPGPAPGPKVLEAAAREAEAAALSVEGISKMDGAAANWGKSRLHIAATNGFSGGYGRTSHSVHAVAICGDGANMERDYAFEARMHWADMPSPSEIGRLAAERTIARAGASKPPTGAWPVIYDERVSSGLIGHLVQAVSGSSVARGSSWLKDSLGEAVLPSRLDLTEDPARPKVAGSKPFDAEGLLAVKRSVVADGILQGWTLDLATSRELGMKSTASAARSTGAPPSPAAGNLTLTQGDKSHAELMAEMGTGLLITSLMGASINPTTGDYSRGASGFWVENGEIVRPVNECTIAGNLREMLKSLTPANDARPHLSRVVPSLLVEGLVIAGN
ncbi:MAG: TldD/PmbA family protein [Pseudomonadota bacterium]